MRCHICFLSIFGPVSCRLGTVSSGREKYSTFNVHAAVILGTLPKNSDEDLLCAAYSSNSWKRLSAALNSVKKFARDSGIVLSWPLCSETVIKYVSWALKKASLSPNTVKVYLSDICLYHKLKGLDSSACCSFTVRTMLKGAVNLNSYSVNTKPRKVVVTLSILKLIGHELSLSGWCEAKKAAFWAACTVAFFGSFRMGELLCLNNDSFSRDTLLWSDVIFEEKNSVTIHVRHPKSNKQGGEKIVVFSFIGHNCCPVRALLGFKNACSPLNCMLPVFTLPDGTYLTKEVFNSTLMILLKDHLPGYPVLGHSFRAGIPSALSARPDLASTEEIQAWGRWSSDSHRAYARHSHLARRSIFDKFVLALQSYN